jgi:hypothetical protein
MHVFNEDLFLAFCSGRDTFSGLMGRPDQWSFTTGGMVWVDQSWLSHAIYYLSYLALDEWGPVLIKAGLLIGCLTVLYYRCRALGVSPEISCFALSIGTLSLAPFLGIRAENFALFYFVLMTSFLTAPRTWGKWRWIGSIAVFAVWSNSHGSFMLGFGLLGLKFAVELAAKLNIIQMPDKKASPLETEKDTPDGEPDLYSDAKAQDQYQVAGWFCALVAAAFIMVLANPYGPSNAVMPFRQLSVNPVTSVSEDWASLFQSVSQGKLLALKDVRPFIGFVAVTVGLFCFVIWRLGMAGAQSKFSGSGSTPAVMMEYLIPVVLIPAAFTFRRLILFASLALVPIAALLMNVSWELIRKWTTPPRLAGIKLKTIATAFLVVWISLLSFKFYTYILLFYLPGNPIYFDKPLARRLMSSSYMEMDVGEFIKKNGISGRFFADWTFSDLLLFKAPGIKVFMDCRDQSAYTDEIIRTYFFVLNSSPSDLEQALAILDISQVEFVCIRSTHALGIRLMSTGKWACIYRDEEALLLARTDSEKFGPIVRWGKFHRLWYGSEDTRVVTHAFSSLFLNGRVPSELLPHLKAIVQRVPNTFVYALIKDGLSGRDECLSPEARSFFDSEDQRLSRLDYMVAGGAVSILKGHMMILGSLAQCTSGQQAEELDRRRKARQATYTKLWDEYR